MSRGRCPNCGASVKLAANKTDAACQYCDSTFTFQTAETQFNEVRHSAFGGTLLIADTSKEGGNYEEAITFYNKIIEQQPDFADAWLNKGVCMVRMSTIGNLRIPEAVSSWKAAIAFAKNPEAMKMRVALEPV